MFYNKRRSFFKDIIYNNNSKIYLALVVIMVAVIVIIGSNIINNPDMINSETQSASETSTPEASDAFSGEEISTENQDVNKKELTDTAIFIYPDNKLLTVNKLDENNEYSTTIASARCHVAEDVYAMLGDEESLCISPKKESNKRLWYMLYESVYTQYYLPYDSLSIHSPLYTINGDYNSIISESYEAIDRNSEHTSYGITVTTNTARWLYENVPLGIDIYIVRTEKNIKEENNLDAEYIINNRLLTIPKGFTSDPTDINADSMWCTTEFERIDGLADKTQELGTIAFSIFTKDVDYLYHVYSDMKAYNTVGEDISEYINLKFDLTGFTEEELLLRNYQGWLLPGQYPVTVILADMYGNNIYETIFLNIVDTTAPIINFNQDITEINREQLTNEEYIRSMVTITELRQLTSADVVYRIEEENNVATIYYSVTDASGNVGELVVNLNIR